MNPRWMKMLRDARLARGRLALIIAALAMSIAAVVTMASSYSVLAREVSASYQGSKPASVQLEIAGSISPALLERIAARPDVAAAELAATVMARVEAAPGQWLPMRVFVVPRLGKERIDILGQEGGAWPPPSGALVIERSALALSGGTLGGALKIELRRSGRHFVPIAAVAHDPGLAPAWQEKVVYAYATPETLEALSEPVALDLLKIIVAAGANDSAAIERTARSLASWLRGEGITVHEMRIPPPGRHPHQDQMNAVVLMLLLFSLMVLLLGAVLAATVIGGLLAQQVRQIAIMKAVGARTRQVAAMYMAMTAVLGLAALAIGLPLGVAGGRALIAAVAELLNLRLASTALPWQLFATAIGLGLAAPLLAAVVPILSASRITVQAALHDRDVNRAASTARSQRILRSLPLVDIALTLALRNLFRRRARLAMTVLLLAGAGAMFMTSMNLRAAWEDSVQRAAADRRFDLELRLQDGRSGARALAIVKSLAAVRSAEAWSLAPAALPGVGGFNISRRYPDGGHGAFTLRSAPPGTTLLARSMIAGRWLREGESGTAVLNQQAIDTIFPGAAVGSWITISIDGKPCTLRVAGVMRDILAPAAVFVTPQTFAAATGSDGINALRIALNEGASMAEVVSALGREGIGISARLTGASMAQAQGSHIYILVWALGFIAATMAMVGMMGLGSSMGTSVLERTREFGVMRSLGASSRVVVRSVLYEGALTALASMPLALAAAVLPSAAVGRMLASISSQPLVLQLSSSGAALWLGGVLLAALAASCFPATRASTLTIKQTLDWEYAA